MILLKYIRLQPMLLPLGVLLLACNRLPDPDFSWGPEDNPEAGAVIWFANQTPEASFYEWHFGDQIRSDLENPTHIFEQPGTYQVELTAYNDAGSQTRSRAVSITAPTILVFTITDSTGTLPLAGAEIRLYDNQGDWDEVNNPLLVSYTNSLGQVEFSNMDPIVYYLWAFLDEADGYWISGGYTPVLNLNEINSFLIPCEWFSHVQTKATLPFPMPGKEFKRTD
jgi:hypothetical protein